VFGDGFLMVNLWWFEAFSWLFAGMFFEAEKFLLFGFIWGLRRKGGAANPFWEWRTESIEGCRFFLFGSAFVADKVDDVKRDQGGCCHA
jgi:hypothetical protein